MGLLRTSGPAPSLIAPALGADITAVHIHERIRRGLGIKSGNPVKALSDELVAVVIADDLTKHDAGVTLNRRFSSAHEFTPVNNGLILLFNPLGSGVRITVETIYRFGASTARAFWRRNDSTAGFTKQGAGVGGTWGKDPASGAVASGLFGSRAEFWNQDAASVPTISGGYIPWMFGASQPPTTIQLGLNPGQGFQVQSVAVGAFDCSFDYTERDLEP